MARVRGGSVAFRAALPDPALTPPPSPPKTAALGALHPTRRQSIALLAALVLVAGAVTALSVLVRPERARSFDVFSGSVFLEDAVAPVGVDLVSGKPTVRLLEADSQVGAKTSGQLAVTPLADETLLVNRRTGEFNMVDSTGFLVKPSGGVPLPRLRGATAAVAVPAGLTGAAGQSGYIEQTSSTRTSIYLVSRSTVDTATSAAKVQPRAFLPLSVPVSTAAGSSAASDGDLWVLAGATGGTRIIKRLSLPAGSKPGAMLDVDNHGTVNGPAALEAATTGDTTDQVAALATDRQIAIFDRDKPVGAVRFTAPPGVTEILPASNAHGRLWFLMKGSTGWSVVSVATDGTDLRGPTRLGDVAPEANLVPPAVSNGALYTMDRVGGQFLRVTDAGAATGLRGVGRYPLAAQGGKTIEPGGFTDAYVLARGSRVIFNSPEHRDALVVFTDGSRAPLRVQKGAAVSLNAGGGTEALTRSRLGNPTGKPKPGQTAPKKTQTAPVTGKVDCRTAVQVPHQPAITRATPGSQTLALQWSYTLTGPQDCEPSTYQVQLTALTDGAPSPAPVTVQGQKSVNLAGLDPSTRYEVAVTAYINGEGSTSPSVQVTTSESGPDAPSGVQVAVASNGTWTVNWSSCGTARNGCVPAATWRVIPQFCDGLGLSTAPSPLEVTADQTTTVQPPVQLVGGSALLGRGVRFQVEGLGVDGTVGTPSSVTGCTYSWGNPIPGDIAVSASAPATLTPGSTTFTNVVVRSTSSAALGGVGAQLTYRLLAQDGSTVSSVGPTTNTAVQLNGIAAGQSYRVSVSVAPPRHPEAAVTLPALTVQRAYATWPTPGVRAQATYDDSGTTGRLAVSFDLGGPTGGETFDLVNSALVCGSNRLALQRSDVSSGQTMVFQFDRLLYYGDCTVTVQLIQNASTATSPPLFGATSSPSNTTSTISIDKPQATTLAGDFSARWSDASAAPQVAITYSGADDFSQSSDWTMTVSNGAGSCGSVNGAPPATIVVDQGCVDSGGAATLSIDYTYLGAERHFADIPVTGTPPQPVDPTQVSFDAGWSGGASSPTISVHYTGSLDAAALRTLTWQETVVSNGQTCGSALYVPGTGDFQIGIDYNLCPPTDSAGNFSSYLVEIQAFDPTNNGLVGDYRPGLSGTPPR